MHTCAGAHTSRTHGHAHLYRSSHLQNTRSCTPVQALTPPEHMAMHVCAGTHTSGTHGHAYLYRSSHLRNTLPMHTCTGNKVHMLSRLLTHENRTPENLQTCKEHATFLPFPVCPLLLRQFTAVATWTPLSCFILTQEYKCASGMALHEQHA